jgi:hypothetical protein
MHNTPALETYPVTALGKLVSNTNKEANYV